MRIGYFGGTFDPPHRGHLHAALLAADRCRLDRVLLAPVHQQPLKIEEAAASYDDRLAMVRLLCATDPRLEPSGMDAARPDGTPNYTVDALARLREQEPGAEIFAISGADSFMTLRQWHEPERLLALAEWIVVARPEYDLQAGIAALVLTPQQRDRVHLLPELDDDTSGTELRARLRAGVSPGHRLSPEVLLYISRMHLYHARR